MTRNASAKRSMCVSFVAFCSFCLSFRTFLFVFCYFRLRIRRTSYETPVERREEANTLKMATVSSLVVVVAVRCLLLHCICDSRRRDQISWQCPKEEEQLRTHSTEVCMCVFSSVNSVAVAVARLLYLLLTISETRIVSFFSLVHFI